MKNLRRRVLALFALITLVTGLSLPATANVLPGPGGEGEIHLGDRSYLVWVPPTYDPAKPTPVMVGYSAKDDTTENFRNYSGLRESALGQEAIILYPRAIGAAWEGAPFASTGPGQDIDFVRAMIDDAGRHYNIDRSRLYATGLSTGGGMAAVTACHMADLFAGVAGVSGAYYWPVNEGCQDIPIAFIAYHGTGDTLTKYHGGLRHETPYLPVPTMFASYEKRNRCIPGAVAEERITPNVVRVNGGGCLAPTQVVRIEGGEHTWWHEPNVANDMWAMLSGVTKPRVLAPAEVSSG